MKKVIFVLLIGICNGNPGLINNYWKYWKPSHYSLDIATNMEEETFFGEVRIAGKVLQRTNTLGIQSRVNISEGYYTIKGKNISLNLNLSTPFKMGDIFVIPLKQTLVKDVQFMITLKFNGTMAKRKGIYMTSYKENNKKKKLLVVHTKPTEANFVFPCVDVPVYKAVFEIKVGRPALMKTLSNMPIKNTSGPDSKINGQVWDTFQSTPKMSTYEVSFVIFDQLESRKTSTNTIWFSESSKEHVLLPFEAVTNFIVWMENYTGIANNFPKIDVVVVPLQIDFIIKNHGLMILSNKTLFKQNGITTFLDAMEFVILIAYIIVNHWFTNLITCENWADFWLNDGISSYILYMIMDEIYPNSNAMEIFISIHQKHAMNNDFYFPFSLGSAMVCFNANLWFHSIKNVIFWKGGAVIGMVANVITNNHHFKEGLKTHLIAVKTDSDVKNDFWTSLQEKMTNSTIPKGETFTSLMYGWVNNNGYPLLTVIRHENGSVFVKQEWLKKNFFEEPENDLIQYYWWVPLSYTTSKERNFKNVQLKEWIRPVNQSQRLAVTIEDDEWIILNLQNKGYYRVNYDRKTWELIAKDLLTDFYGQIHPTNREKIIDDSIMLIEENRLNCLTFLNLSKYLKAEFYLPPLKNGILFIETLIRLSMDSSVHYDLKNYYKYIIFNVYKHVTSRNFLVKNAMDYEVKILMIKYGCSLNFTHCNNQVEQLLYDILDGKMDIKLLNQELRAPFWCTASKIGGERVLNYIRQKYITEEQLKIKDDYLSALFCTKDRMLFNSLLKDILNKADYLRNISCHSLLHKLVSEDSLCYAVDYYYKNLNNLTLCTNNTNNAKNRIILAQIIHTYSKHLNCTQRIPKSYTNNHQITKIFPANTFKTFWNNDTADEVRSWFNSIAINVTEDDIISDTNMFINDNYNFFTK